MITELFIFFMFLLHFQLTEITQYLYYYKTLSSSTIVSSLINNNYHELTRIITSNLFHNGLQHLLINMISFISVGIPLEEFFGNYDQPHQFNGILYLKVLFYLMVFSGIQSIIYHYITYLITGNQYFNQVQYCGFSAVLLGLNFITNFLKSGSIYNALKQCFLHVLCISIIIPGTSTIGHLAGVLSGLVVAKVIGL
jgi:membrane associated rhomboid family serine protease